MSVELRTNWQRFRRKHKMVWTEIINDQGERRWKTNWPDGCVELLRSCGGSFRTELNGGSAITPDGRKVDTKDIIFTFPSKDLAALFKLSYF